MFDRLTERLSGAVAALSGRGRLTEDNITDALRQVRLALIEADVAVPVVKSFIDAVKARAIGTEVQKSLTPGQVFIKVLHEELVRVMGEPGAGLNLNFRHAVDVDQLVDQIVAGLAFALATAATTAFPGFTCHCQIPLEGQAALAGSLRQSLHPTVVDVGATIKHNFLNTGGERTLGHQLANRRRSVGVGTGLERLAQ